MMPSDLGVSIQMSVMDFDIDNRITIIICPYDVVHNEKVICNNLFCFMFNVILNGANIV